METIEIKPCICGEQPKVHTRVVQSENIGTDFEYNKVGYFVRCPRCRSKILITDSNEADAVKRWNGAISSLSCYDLNPPKSFEDLEARAMAERLGE